ncbi:VOC family protein [Jatrophihabitans endophyticus]|uniref:VOC family protein n=1 Tax=Jatrophihabitans endophyticus TaxID=1206085 RepID=UPI0019DD7DB6|nr:VOC family protein [Jatrophihabitans endophyticus]MBE7188018.1 VOC family protein [Jatrophihabitans endophyticus]
MASTPITRPTAIHHVRLTVTDIHRSKAFYQQLLGDETAFDFSDRVDEPGVRDDPAQLYGGAGFQIGDQLLGLRPVASPDDSFRSTRVGLDHLSLLVGSEDELHEAARRLDDAGVEHGEVAHLEATGMVILSIQDPDDINIELVHMPSE